MSSEPKPSPRSAVRFVGSMWFAAVLLTLLLVGMACATVYESMHGTGRALSDFYLSWWFELLLALLAVNLGAAVVLRYPFSRWHTGFVITHMGILVTLAGALVTKHLGVNGQIGFYEGETVQGFRIPGAPALSLRASAEKRQASVDLIPWKFNGYRRLKQMSAPGLTLGNIDVEILEYLPDSEVSERIANDNPHPRTAVRVSLSPTGLENPVWLFADQNVRVGRLTAALRVFDNEAELARALAPEQQVESESGGMIKVAYKDSSFEIPLQDALDKAIPVGDTNRTLRALRYVSHALVEGAQVVNDPRRPPNPAIQVEVSGPDGKSTQWVFAKFPNFRGMHGNQGGEELKVTFAAPTTEQHRTASAPIVVFAGPGGALHARFETMGHGKKTQKLTTGTPVDSPWPKQKFAVLDRLDRARLVRDTEPVQPVREERVPAVLVNVVEGEESNKLWLQKYRPHSFKSGGTDYELSFGDKKIPFDFGVRLDRFEVGYYPGERRPRSFTSQITIIDPVSGGTRSAVVSMNNPAEYGKYNFYQSSYRLEKTRTASFISVAWDPGLPVVFVGYGATMAGMVITLITRSIIYRRTGQRSKSSHAGVKSPVRTRDPLESPKPVASAATVELRRT